MSIDPLSQSIGVASVAPSLSSTAEAGPAFADSLKSMLRAVETAGTQADDAVTQMLAGQGDVHTALIALQHADTTFQLTVQIRNKLVQAYQDVMRMPI